LLVSSLPTRKAATAVRATITKGEMIAAFIKVVEEKEERSL
jgi:hypothetical protein